MYKPPMYQLSQTHYLRSWLAHPLAPKIKKPAVLKNLDKILGGIIKK
jgi:oligopeptide transport system ATP-binding protein